MSVNLQLTATATGDNFTLVQSGNVVNVYYNQPETGTPLTTVAASDLSSITINGVGADTVTIDTAGGNPLPSSVTVASGAVTFNQDLGTGGAAVDLTVATGAAADFAVTQHLNSLTVAAGASANTTGSGSIVLNTDTMTLDGAVNLATDSLVVTSPNAADTSIVGATTDANAGVVSSTAVVTTTVAGTVSVVDDGGATITDLGTVDGGTLVATPVEDSGSDTADASWNEAAVSIPTNSSKTATVSPVTTGNAPGGPTATNGTAVSQSVTGSSGPNGPQPGVSGPDPQVDANGSIAINITTAGCLPGDYTMKFTGIDSATSQPVSIIVKVTVTKN